MTDLAALLRAVILHPEDDTPRLVMADYLDENGEPDRAAFIRLQCRTPGNSVCVWVCNCGCGRLAKDHGISGTMPAWMLVGIPHSLPTRGVRGHGSNWEDGRIVFRRGFVDEVRCPLDQWMTHGPQLVREHPLTRVVVADKSAAQPYGPPWWVWEFEMGGIIPPRDHELPQEIWRLLLPVTSDSLYVHESEGKADAALSAACLAWARGQPGVPASPP